ncbi:hypothetical protein ATZ33_00815 [Enterococcus silesiacus]|uniref:Uncharacterized protein n=1 Tax=Enterococcus silesiacus TaxID=332949 RepID=A0A0S3K6Z1_9ENTE|nr:hypothetical protein [Enterococcus silesiacus]ALR99972.1 hypothetical protein ATZ33_00815 [Enterococcus silesiacus]OJG92719.1 hypothetical protein RV15_GL002664 [Enterococcus silesiacus]
MENAEVKNIDYRSRVYKNIINEIELKRECREFLECKSIDFDKEEFESIDTIFNLTNFLLLDKKVSLTDFNNIFFNNLTYTCSNVFFDKLQNDISDREIEKGFKRIIENINKECVIVDQYDQMKKNGFNLLDYVTPMKSNEIVFPVLSYDTEYLKLFCVVQFYKNNKREYRMCSVILNRLNREITFYINGTIGAFELKNYSKEIISGPKSFFPIVKRIISSMLGVTFIDRKSHYVEERKKIFQFCKNLNQEIIKDYSNELEDMTKSVIERQIGKISKELKILNNEIKMDKVAKKNIYDKIFNTYLGEYITKGFNEKDLKCKAIEYNLACYPTKISFTGQELAKGKAAARNKKVPLAFENVFYSLNTDLDSSEQLEEVTLAWFDTDFFENSKDLDVSQTTISINKKCFLVTMKNTVNKNRRMTDYVEKTIRNVL